MDTTRQMSCDFYTREQWDEAASQMADMLQQHVFDRHFGVAPWLVEEHYVFFGNEGATYINALVETVRQEIEMMVGMQELGMGISKDGYSWAIVVKIDHEQAGFDYPDTDDALRVMETRLHRAWRISRGILQDEPGQRPDDPPSWPGFNLVK
jgi:hypothetical protein